MQTAWTAAGISVEVLESVGSTNAEALQRARAGSRGPIWIVARRQEAGRGRRGRHWASEPGNLFATLLLTNSFPPAQAPQLSFVAALAVHDAVTESAPAIAGSLSLKWPNDVLLRTKKFSGILVEGESAPDGALAVAIGIGVNCRHHPDDVAYPATNLAAEGAALAPEEMFRAVATAMQRRLAQWAQGANFGAIRTDWIARGPRPGERMNVRLDRREIAGGFETLDEAGRLVLRLADGSIETVTAGEILDSGVGTQSLQAQE